MNTDDLRDALRLDARQAGEPPGDLLERVEGLRRQSDRRRAGVLAAAAGVALVVAAVPAGSAWLTAPTDGDAAAPADPPAGEPVTPSVEAQRADAAETFGITDPPQVPVVALVTPEEKEELMDACMTAAGWPPDALFREGVPAERVAAVNLASYICEVSYPIDPSYVGVPPEEDRIID